MPELTQLRQSLMTLQEKLKAYNHAIALIYYDGATTAPRGTGENRAHTLGILSGEHYQLSTGEETRRLLEELDAQRDGLTPSERRMTELLLKDIRQMSAIPMEEYTAYQELLALADDAWHRAKEASDFPMFLPYLERIVETSRRFAQLIAPDRAPYDYWLSEYEDGLDTRACDAFFETLRSRLVPLIFEISHHPQVDDRCLYGAFPVTRQHELSLYLMSLLRLSPDHVGLATTEHPFTTSLGCHLDERITTHYLPEAFASSMYSVIHEGGHALYDTGSRREYAYTVLDGGVSMGVHESQSRFYENLLGRSRPFLTFLQPKLAQLFPSLSEVTPDQLYRAVNKVEPSLIRTEADEVTYSLHVLIRYELEKRLMTGELPVKDLPGEWNRLYQEVLGVRVIDDRSGVLQDSHWSGGSIGYFPSYALGNAYGAQLMAAMRESVDVDTCLASGDLAPINEWNRQHIWQHGKLTKPGDLMREAFRCQSNPEGKFDPAVYLNYLEQKCREVYGL